MVQAGPCTAPAASRPSSCPPGAGSVGLQNVRSGIMVVNKAVSKENPGSWAKVFTVSEPLQRLSTRMHTGVMGVGTKQGL
jgi:hypothetical protein